MQQKLMKQTAVFSLLFSAAALGLIFYMTGRPAVAIEDIAGANRSSAGSGPYAGENGANAPPGETSVSVSDGTGSGTSGGNSSEADLTDSVNHALSAGETGTADSAGTPLAFKPDGEDTNYLCIPLPPGIDAGRVTIENHYLDEEMWVVVRDAPAEFYETAAISGNRQAVTAGICSRAEAGGNQSAQDQVNQAGTEAGGNQPGQDQANQTQTEAGGNQSAQDQMNQAGTEAVLKFSLTGVYEYRNILEGDKLYIEFVPPREMYDRIIVVDPAFGGSETGVTEGNLQEKDITLAVAGKLKEKLDGEEIKVYYTRIEDNNLTEEKRVKIANSTKADMLIRIEANADGDSMVNGTTAIYNEDFFIPGFGSIELADILEKEVVSNIKGKAVGLEAAAETDYVIRNATVPAAAIKVGYLTNAQEAILLKKDDYIDKIATGIYRAIMTVYESHLTRED